MTLARRLQGIALIWFLIVLVLFTGGYVAIFYERSLHSFRELLQLEMNAVVAKAGATPELSSLNNNWEGYALFTNSVIRFVDANGEVTSQAATAGFPLYQMPPAPAVGRVEPSPEGNARFGNTVWLNNVSWSAKDGHHSAIGLEKTFTYPDGDIGEIQVIGILDGVLDETVQTAIWTLFLDVVIFAVLTIGTYLILKRGLAPLSELIDGIRSVEWSRATRIDEPSGPREVTHLTRSINQLLERVDNSMHDQARFIADASHELRTPLSIIAGHVNLLRRWGRERPDVWEPAVKHLVREVSRLQNLVENLLTASRLENGRKPSPDRLGSSDIEGLLETLNADAHVLRPDLEFGTVVHLTRGANAYINQDDLRQVLIIVIDNALRYTQKQGLIQLMVVGDRDGIRFSVRDNGNGIDKEELPHVFDRFYRARSAKEVNKGSGLGLAIAKEIVTAYSGRIHIHSKIQQGTTVSIWIPGIRTENADFLPDVKEL